jgi:choline dehydrogenase
MLEPSDVVVVGAGSAGCVLAARLSEDPSVRVTLLEAGGRDSNPLFHVPIMVAMILRLQLGTWNYVTEPEAGLGGRTAAWPRGKVLGGTSSINGMQWVRGRPSDYEGWAQAGLPQWRWESVLAGFRRLERFAGGASEMHGADGEVPVSAGDETPEWAPLYDAFAKAGQQAGYPFSEDFNAPPFEGVGRNHFNISGGRRWSAARAFLRPAEARPNLRVVTNAHATRVVIENGRAVGVAARVAGRDEMFRAGEIVLCGGALNSPQLLMLSGIGGAEALRGLDIPVASDLPGVGGNLSDHPQVRIIDACKGARTVEWLARADRAALALARALATGKGPAGSMPFGMGFYLRSDERLEEPDLQGTFIAGDTIKTMAQPFSAPSRGSYCILVNPLRPHSLGSVALRSADPFAAPVIRPNWWSDPRDLHMIRRGVGIARKILAQPAFDPYRGPEIAPGAAVQDDPALDAWIAQTAGTTHHPAGTCRMGVDTDPTAVVDGELRVRGVEGLRVADASIMPAITSGNTNAPCMMIGQQCADFILAGRRAA